MTRLISNIFALAAVLLVAAPASAAEVHGFPWVDFAVNLFNFAIFLGILVYFAGPKIQGYFAERRHTLIANLDAARELREQAQAKLDEYGGRLAALDEERRALLAEYHAQGEREKERIIADAKRQVERMKSDAELILQQEVRRAVATIEQQAVDQALEMATTTVRERMDEKKQNVLVDRYVQELKSMQA